MDYYGAKIQQYPARIRRSLAVLGSKTPLLKRLLNFLAYGFNLAISIAAGDDEILAKGADIPDIQHDNVASLLVRGCIHGSAGYFNSFQ